MKRSTLVRIGIGNFDYNGGDTIFGIEYRRQAQNIDVQKRGRTI